MPTEPSSLELLTVSAALMLKNNPDLIELADDGILGSNSTGLYVFSGTDNDKPFINVEGTGMCSIVVSAWQDGGARSRFSSAHFMTLQILVFADVSRGMDNEITNHDAQAKAFRIYDKFDPIFHDNRNISKNWWGLTILDSQWAGGPNIYPVEEEDNLYVLQATYTVKI